MKHERESTHANQSKENQLETNLKDFSQIKLTKIYLRLLRRTLLQINNEAIHNKTIKTGAESHLF